MTTLKSWVSYTDTGERPDLPRAIYLASDSRITWGGASRRWEAGRKVFVPNVEPHLFGFCGDVVLPALLIGQLVSSIDAGVLFSAGASADDRHDAVLRAVERAVGCAISTPTIDFVIHHLQRQHAWPNTSFRAWSISYSASRRTCTSQQIAIPPTTAVVGAFGSGQPSAQAHHDLWQKSDAGGRSRAILASFCDSIKSGEDPLSGGPPQLAALYTKGPPVQIGMYVDGSRYINGLQVDVGPNLLNAEWRDCLGQVVDPQTGDAAQGTRRFFRPKKLSKSQS